MVHISNNFAQTWLSTGWYSSTTSIGHPLRVETKFVDICMVRALIWAYFLNIPLKTTYLTWANPTISKNFWAIPSSLATISEIIEYETWLIFLSPSKASRTIFLKNLVLKAVFWSRRNYIAAVCCLSNYFIIGRICSVRILLCSSPISDKSN